VRNGFQLRSKGRHPGPKEPRRDHTRAGSRPCEWVMPRPVMASGCKANQSINWTRWRNRVRRFEA
jgi:hypothetical protein